MYGGNYYGCREADIRAVVERELVAVMPIDICGAIAVKNAFAGQCIIVFTDRSRRAVLRSIINRSCPDDEKILRILSLDSEFRNKNIADVCLDMNGGTERAAAELKTVLFPSDNGSKISL